MYDPEIRRKWDKTVLKLESQNLTSNVFVTYQQTKGVLALNNKEFIDKQIRFSEAGRFYVYYSALPLDSELV